MIKATYIDHMGSDLKVVNSARVSFNKESKELMDKDKKLIKYLAENGHLTPFQHCSATVLIECPLFIRSQIQRHRMATYSEKSLRYTSDDITFYTPASFKEQSTNNKQGSGGLLEEAKQKIALRMTQNILLLCENVYKALIKLGVAKEQARYILPSCTMTKFYMTSDLRNWIHFIKLRDHPHAQEEAQLIARQVKQIMLELYPESVKALMEVDNE